ncbi:MAG: DUF447 family protein [Methanoregula sp.]|nr:DUF447 family protein [Methanoregula sp.]
MGLLKPGINEVIATTEFNAAPIGIIFKEGVARMVVFSGSHTAKNIEKNGWLVANFVYDPVLYVKTAFEDPAHHLFFEETINDRKMHRLKHTDAWAAFTTTIDKKTNEALMVTLTLEKEIIEEVSLHPVNRGFNSIIDSTVHATRYKMNHDPELKKLIDYHAGIVRKCGGKRELEALELLLGYIT